MGNSIFLNEKLTDRNIMESVLSSHYIIDYGFIKSVNDDKTIDVVHAKQLKTLDGKTLKPTVTPNVEVLTLSGSGIAIKFDYKTGDKVLLLGLKDYIKKVEEVTSATETTAYIHYSRETLKAIPMCVFNDQAKVRIEVEDGALTIECKGDVSLKTDGDVTVEATNVTAKCSSFKVTDSNGTAALEVTP